MNELTQLRPKLVRLKLSGILETLDERMKRALEEKWSPSRFLLTLMTDEVERRDQTQTSRRLTKSGLDHRKTLETFDFAFNTRVHESSIRELALCNFIEKKDNIFFLGPSGVGKTHLATALGHEACRRGYETLFKKTNALFDWIIDGKGDGTLGKRLNHAIQIPLLIMDDFGLKELSPEAQSLLYDIISERHEKASIIITSNRDFSEWPAVFTNPLMASAAMDRLVHRAFKTVIEGKSYRLDSFIKNSKEKITETK